MQFLGGKTYGVSYIQDGQASTNAIFGDRRQLRARPRCGRRVAGPVQLVPAPSNGGLAGVIVTTKRGSSRYSGTSFYDFNSDSLNALTYNQTLSGTKRGNTAVGHAPASLGRESWRTTGWEEAVLLQQL